MINFTEERYGVKVSCHQVSQDGYEVSNLITRAGSTFYSRNKGFLVEHFIKPPVDVNFFFPIPIFVSYLELGLCVGAQTTDGIEILVSTQTDEKGVLHKVFHQCPISKNYLKVVNGRSQERAPVNEKPCPNSEGGGTNFFKFSHLLYNVRIIRVRLIKTLGSSVPALGSVKIWGQPARTCKPEEWERILSCNTNGGVLPSVSDNDDIQILPSEESRSTEILKSEVEVPEEFIDPLTFDIMTLPVLLPSGQSVDRSTLEKFNNCQASWGRIACDPFTGVPFGSGRQPISNLALKARIDAFLVKNAQVDLQLANVPRSVGEKPKECITATPSPFLTELSPMCVPTTSSIAKPTSSKAKVEPNLKYDEQGNSHEKDLEDSLNLALNSYFKKVSRPARKVSDSNSCVGCKELIVAPCYKLPCGHLVCRICLLDSDNLCNQCKKQFHKEQVTRTYKIA